jgi:hypothetical protein
MTRLESILEEAKLLSPSEREKLMAALAEQAAADAESDAAVAQRGLAYLTESTRSEDWSEFYPDRLRRKARGESV